VFGEEPVPPFPEAVVGQAGVAGLNEFGGGEVADSVSCLDGGDAEGDERGARVGMTAGKVQIWWRACFSSTSGPCR
jgi:hypothetical protein